MFVIYTVVAIVFSLVLLGTIRGKLVKDPRVTMTMDKLGVPRSWYPPLAAVEFLGVLGLVAGIVYRPFGIAASIGLVLYFLGAVITHLRARDVKGAPVPSVLALVAGVPLVFGLASL